MIIWQYFPMENKYSNKYLIETGIGLQDVDKLKNSSYFIKQSKRYINNEITLDELEQIIAFYYRNKINTSKRVKEIRILHAIKENPKVKTDELALMLGVSVRTIKSLIATLEKNKVIERVGGKRFGCWKII